MNIKYIECPDCEGTGEHYEDTSGSCMTVVSECCGGCGYTYGCETCEGKGEIEKDE